MRADTQADSSPLRRTCAGQWWQTRARKRFRLAATLSVMAAAGSPGCALEQVQLGQWYALHTAGAGACPPAFWRFVVLPDRAIEGNVASDWATKVAKLSGTLAADDSFRMTATALQGGASFEATGRFTTRDVTLTEHGAKSPCDGRSFTVGRVAGPGMNGGGG